MSNLPPLIKKLNLLPIYLDIKIIDDASNDGTVDEIQKLIVGENLNNIEIHKRPSKLGLRSAYIFGFTKGLEEGYEIIVQMDGDGSHRPDDLVKLIWKLESDLANDLVIGSRWVQGGKFKIGQNTESISLVSQINTRPLCWDRR